LATALKTEEGAQVVRGAGENRGATAKTGMKNVDVVRTFTESSTGMSAPANYVGSGWPQDKSIQSEREWT